MPSLKQAVSKVGKCLKKVSKGVTAIEKVLAKLTKLLSRRGAAKDQCADLLDLWNAAIATRQQAEGLRDAAQEVVDDALLVEQIAANDYNTYCE